MTQSIKRQIEAIPLPNPINPAVRFIFTFSKLEIKKLRTISSSVTYDCSLHVYRDITEKEVEQTNTDKVRSHTPPVVVFTTN